jgi:hypothetical protein
VEAGNVESDDDEYTKKIAAVSRLLIITDSKSPMTRVRIEVK